MISAAAAAFIILALVVSRRSPPPFAAPSSAVHGTEVVAFIPIGEVQRVTEFRWASPVEASRYIVVVRYGGGSAEILRRETTNQQLDIGPDLAGRFPRGLYNWSVEALDHDGRIVATSRILSFEIR